MNNPDHISESLGTIFWVKIFKLFDGDPGWNKFGSGKENTRIRERKYSDPGWKNSDSESGINIQDPQTLRYTHQGL